MGGYDLKYFFNVRGFFSSWFYNFFMNIMI